MARKQGSKYPKRERERNIQGWFDPYDPQDKIIIDIVDRVMVEEGLTQKQIIAIGVTNQAVQTWGQEAIIKLVSDSRNPYQEVMMQLMNQMNQQNDKIEKMYGLLASGQLVAASPDNQEAMARIKEDIPEFDDISLSIGRSYRVYEEDD